MSHYTMTVRNIVESYAGLKEHADFSQIPYVIQQALPQIFNFTFPIFDETYRIPLETKIITQYFMREIGQETTAEWKLYLMNKLNLIMPYYNQLYKSALLQYEPFLNVDYQRTSNRKATREQIETSKANINRDETRKTTDDGMTTTNQNVDNTSTNNSQNVNSDTPQGLIPDALDKKYATDLSQATSSGTDTTKNNTTVDVANTTNVTSNASESDTRNNNRNATDLDEYIEHIKGKEGSESYSKMLMELRETFLNIDELIIRDLEQLFFGLM